MERIGRAAAARGIPAFTGVNTAPSEQAALVANGFRILTVASDTDLMVAGAEAAIADTKKALGR